MASDKPAASVLVYYSEEAQTCIASETDVARAACGAADHLDMAALGRQRQYGRLLRGLDALAAARLHASMDWELTCGSRSI